MEAKSLLPRAKPMALLNMNTTDRDTVFALALLAIVRKAKAAYDSGDVNAVESSIPVLKTEVRNILIEHLTIEQIADIAASDLSRTIARVLMEFCVNVEHIVASTEKFCSEKLGREVKV